MQTSDCPDCGCNCTHLVQAGQGVGRPWATFECDACGHQFTIGATPQGAVRRFLVKKIPICPVHNVPMRDNGRTGTGRDACIYYACKVPGCEITEKGSLREIDA